MNSLVAAGTWLCISRKVKKSESKSQQQKKAEHQWRRLCISRKVKKSESKSQLMSILCIVNLGCVYPVKLKNLKANHNRPADAILDRPVVYIP